MKYVGYFAWAGLLIVSWIFDAFENYDEALTCAVGAVIVGVIIVERYTR